MVGGGGMAECIDPLSSSPNENRQNGIWPSGCCAGGGGSLLRLQGFWEKCLTIHSSCALFLFVF